MGGGQSHEEKDEERPGKTKEDQEVDRAGSSASKDTLGELPQCMMGDKEVDDMSFMISCTNWY